MRHLARLGISGLAVLTMGATLGTIVSGPAVAAPAPTSTTTSAKATRPTQAETPSTDTTSTETPSTGTPSTDTTHGLGARITTDPVVSPVRTPAAQSAAVAVLPASVDLKKWAVTPGNQGTLNSCVPWVIDYAMLGWYSRYTGRVGQPFAPMYTYSQISGGGDYGSNPTTALQLAVAQGNDTRASYSQGDNNWKTKPTAAERVSAARFKIKGYTTLFVGVNRSGSIAQLQQALATYHPVAIELSVRNGFDYLSKSPTATDNDTTSAIRGDHEVLAVGYDSAGLIVQNSWGTGWANGGFGRISWAVVRKDVGEAETISGFAQAAVAPSVSVPVVGHGVAVVAGHTSKYKATWTVTPGNMGGVVANRAWYQVDGGAWVNLKLGSTRATSYGLVARVGHHYRFAVRTDTGTHVGVARYSVTFTA